MKKRLFIIISIILVCVFVMMLLDRFKKTFVKNTDDKTNNVIKTFELEYGDIAYVSDYVEVKNDKLIDQKIEYDDLGKQTVKYSILDNNKETDHELNVNVVDTSAPIVMLNEKLTLVKGNVDNLIDKIMCADNYDKHPKCIIKGDYNLNEVGVYSLKYIAEDSKGNKTTIDFELNIIEKIKPSSASSETQIIDVINTYKKENNKIGIDVSKWQGEIDWKKVKESGVEFAMIRVGTQGGFGKENYVDKYFVTNIENAIKEDIPVGIYFYSYATNKEEATNQAKWVLEQIKDYKITLPVVFDWENWSKFNNLDLNLYEITGIQETFLNEIKKSGYETARYGSKNYLTNAWQESEHITWLAHYTNVTNYEGEYFMWQLCNNGRVPGINGYVDINVLYAN